MSRYKQPLRLRMRNKILRSANAEIIIAFDVRRTQHIILWFPWCSVEIPVVLISSYVCIFCAILNNLSRGRKNVKYCTINLSNVLRNGCLAQWLLRCSPSSKVLGFDSCRARIFTFFRNRFVLFPFLKEHIGSVCSINLTGNNVAFDSKPKKARTHFLIWDYY